MALQDLKSNLSNYRKPKSEPLSGKERPKPTSFNTMPLSDRIQDKKVQSLNKTPEKVGTTPNKIKQGDKFKGETKPSPMSLEERFLGQTTPTEVNQTEKFKGETTPNEVNQTEKFKGETTPNEVNQTEKFKGETTPNSFDMSSNFLGETTPNSFDMSSNFLGETTPNESDRSSKFLGETTPNLFDMSSNFLGETTPNQMNLSEQFLGETDRQNITQGDRFKGETTPSDFTFSGKLESQGLEVPQKVDFFTNDKAEGFSPFMKTKDDTKFTGINDTQFDNASSLLSNFGGSSRGISFQAGYGQFKVGAATGDTQRYSPDGDRYIDSFTSIGDLLQQRQSPSFLDEMYSKYNLQDPEANKFSLIPQPYILRGIQRKKKGEPQNWGFGFPIDDGLIRGGIVTSTERAALDLVRLGSFFLSVKGILWAGRQLVSQRGNKFNKTWTPANFLAAVGGQHIGFKPDRSGILGLDVTGKYQKVTNPSEYKDKLKTLYLTDPSLQTNILGPFASQIDPKGGFDSVYGIGITNTTRFVNTFSRLLSIDLSAALAGIPASAGGIAAGAQLAAAIGNQIIAGQKAGQTLQRYSAFTVKGKFAITNDKVDVTYGEDVLNNKHDGIESGQTDTDIDKNFKNRPNLLKSEGNTAGANNDIADYNMLAYDKIKELSNDRINTSTTQDFRTKLDSGTRGEANKSDYTTENIENPTTGFGFGNPGKMLDVNAKLRTDQFGIDFSKLKDFKGHYDEVQVKKIGEADDKLDIVPLIFQLGSDASKLQFRGTISGLAENFSPSYNEIKYSGRAEPVYVYDSFKRDISFSFKVYATSRVEMQPLWTKLERLSTYTMPRYSGGGYSAPGNSSSDSNLLLTIGKLYVKTPMILTSLSYTYSDETPWDIDFGTPMGIDIQVGCTILGNDLHQYDSDKVFVFDGSAAAATGTFRVK